MEDDKNPTDQTELMESAKANFRRTMLDSDAFFAIVLRYLPDPSAGGFDMSLFDCEPTFSTNEDGTYKWGVRFSGSTDPSAIEGMPELGAVASVELAIADVNPDKGSAALSKEFTAELARLQIDPSGEQAQDILGRWQRGWTVMATAIKRIARLDPTTHTLRLQSDIEKDKRSK